MSNDTIKNIAAELDATSKELFQISGAMRVLGLPVNAKLTDLGHMVKDVGERLSALPDTATQDKDKVDSSAISRALRSYQEGKMDDEEVQCLIDTYETLGEIFDAIRAANPLDDMFGTALRHSVRMEHRRFLQMMEHRKG